MQHHHLICDTTTSSATPPPLLRHHHLTKLALAPHRHRSFAFELPRALQWRRCAADEVGDCDDESEVVGMVMMRAKWWAWRAYTKQLEQAMAVNDD